MNKTRDAAAAIADYHAKTYETRSNNCIGSGEHSASLMAISGAMDVVEEEIRALPDSDADKVIAELVGALEQRDGGSHDQDCKAVRYKEEGRCNCGHNQATKALAKAREYMEE